MIGEEHEKTDRRLVIGSHHGARAVKADFTVTMDYTDMPPHPVLVRKVILEAAEEILERVNLAIAAADASDDIFEAGP